VPRFFAGAPSAPRINGRAGGSVPAPSASTNNARAWPPHGQGQAGKPKSRRGHLPDRWPGAHPTDVRFEHASQTQHQGVLPWSPNEVDSHR